MVPKQDGKIGTLNMNDKTALFLPLGGVKHNGFSSDLKQLAH